MFFSLDATEYVQSIPYYVGLLQKSISKAPHKAPNPEALNP